MADANYCPRCRSRVRDGARFCTRCGLAAPRLGKPFGIVVPRPSITPQRAAQGYTSQQANPSGPPVRVKTRGGGFRALIFLAVLFGLCRAWINYHKTTTWDYHQSNDWYTHPLETHPLEQSPQSLLSQLAPPIAQQLTYGQGEARQPAPEYPAAAVMRGEQGVVVVRFVVDETGRVVQAGAATPSRWPLLNDAAVQAVRNTWRFGAGPVRTYEVALRFELTHR